MGAAGVPGGCRAGAEDLPAVEQRTAYIAGTVSAKCKTTLIYLHRSCFELWGIVGNGGEPQAGKLLEPVETPVFMRVRSDLKGRALSETHFRFIRTMKELLRHPKAVTGRTVEGKFCFLLTGGQQ